MKILVAGLGLIGGSYCKAISSYTSHEVYGYDLDTGVIKAAEECGCIIQGVTPDSFGLFDMIIVGPVSYTHLDVYKRQCFRILLLFRRCKL